MPCTKCRSDFNLFNWKIKCGECEDKYCNKCLKRREGILYCDKCLILLLRPPDRSKLMELKSKDLQDYLNKRNISTYGLVEKHELVELLCTKHIPERPKKGVEKLTANFAGSVPNLRPINEFLGNLESALSNEHVSTRRTRPAAQPTGSTSSKNASPQHTSPCSETSSYNQNQPTTSATTTHEQDSPQNGSDVRVEDKAETHTPPKYPKIEDFGSAEELHNLSSKDLKILLTLNRVDFKGCVERSELIERAERLWEDATELKKEIPENLPVQDLCKLCMDAPLDCVLLECGHIATCTDCGKKLAECPICRQYVVRVVRTFKA